MFSIQRFSEQFLILFRQNRNRHTMILGIFIIIQLFSLYNHFSGTSHMLTEDIYNAAAFMSIILSIIACQDVFGKLRDTASGIQYMMTPASITEKFTAAWVYSSLFVFAVVQLTYLVVQLLGVNIGNLITGFGSEYGLPEWRNVWELFIAMMFTHSVFFFGSLLFRKNPIIKTVASYIGVVLLLTITFSWMAKLVFANVDLMNSNRVDISMDESLSSSINGLPLANYFGMIGQHIKLILGCIALILWSGSYALLYKKQV